jgi:hypothetical protein
MIAIEGSDTEIFASKAVLCWGSNYFHELFVRDNQVRLHLFTANEASPLTSART